jgi:putative ABC transport system permease protein
VLLSAVALILAVALIEMVLPVLNEVSGRDIQLMASADPSVLFSLVLAALAAGLLAGGYPAWLIAKGQIVPMLSGEIQRGSGGNALRTAMLVIQFSISLFMIIAVTIVFAQNKKVEAGSEVFPREEVVVLDRIYRPEIHAAMETLGSELKRIPAVSEVSFSSQVPFEQSHPEQNYSRNPGDEAAKVSLYAIAADARFADLYDIGLTAGRMLDLDRAGDRLALDDDGNPTQSRVNVLINEAASVKLGFASPEAAVGQRFHSLEEAEHTLEHRIVGVLEDVNLLGTFIGVKPMVFAQDPSRYRLGSVRISARPGEDVLGQIEAVWDRVNPDYPLQARYLVEDFNQTFRIFSGINLALAAFAVVALLVAMIGLFGLAAFMAEQRIKEIGIRKVMGASVGRIVRLLVFQFSRPVVIAVIIASPLSWLAARSYVNFFPDRISMSPAFFLGAGLLVLAAAALTTAFHAFRTAWARPVAALRYE